MCSPLINLCLDKIAANFQRYNFVFTTTEDDNMKLKFEFLQRKYSLELLERLSEKKTMSHECMYVKWTMSEDYVDLLINKYLKVLDTSWFTECSWDKVTSKIAEIGSNVEQIYIQDRYFVHMKIFSDKRPWQDIIGLLPNLKSFTFLDCNDLILKNVVNFCPNIEEINVNISKIGFDAVKYLCKKIHGKCCMKLKKLCIVGSFLRDDDVKYLLTNLPSLEMINYENLPLVLYSLHKNDLSSLDKVEPYNITMLDLMYLAKKPFYADALKLCLSVCPRLKSLTCGLVNKDELKFFSNLSDLEKLHLRRFSDSEININNLLKSKGGKLTSLTVVNCTVSVSVLAESCSLIEELSLNDINFLVSENSKPVLNSLYSCTFANLNFSSSAKAVSLLLTSSAKLASIAFNNCNLLSSEIKAHILKCCELYPIKKISFSFSEIEKEYLKVLLLHCPTLSSLNIKSCIDSESKDELLKFAEILSNKPEINVNNDLERSDFQYLIRLHGEDIAFKYGEAFNFVLSS